MNTIYRLTTLFALTLSTLGADVKFSALPTATSPSTNSYLPIIDLNLLPAAQNQKYLLTNLALVSYVNARGAGNVTNTGASTVGYIPIYTDTTGTQVTPTNALSSLNVTTMNLPNLTASRVMVTDASKNAASSSVTSTELGYVSGVTSAIQTQIDGKVSKSGGTDNTGTLYFPWFAAGSYQQYADSNTQSTATITLDFSSTNYHVIVLTGAVTIASSNLGTNRNWSGEFWNTQSTNCAVTWPSWRFVGGKTTTIDPAQTMRLFARVPLFANDTNVIAVSSQTQ